MHKDKQLKDRQKHKKHKIAEAIISAANGIVTNNISKFESDVLESANSDRVKIDNIEEFLKEI